ncbi:MAG: WG repeat-containing protein [Chitinophagales bacterium]|nr:WG repeat-containing protein [Chitinophagales bacterium]
MKNIIAFVFSCLFFSAFAQEVSNQYAKIGRFNQGVAIVWKSGHCGLITQGGKEIIKPTYDKISGFGKDGIAYTWKDGLVGLINMQGKIIVPNIYGSISAFNGSFAITRKNGLAGMINKQGKVLIENKYEDIRVERNGIIRAVKDGKEVILDLKD